MSVESLASKASCRACLRPGPRSLRVIRSTRSGGGSGGKIYPSSSRCQDVARSQAIFDAAWRDIAPETISRASSAVRGSESISSSQYPSKGTQTRDERGSFSLTPATGGPSMHDELVTVGAHYLRAAASSFRDWSTRMVADFGEAIRPHLLSIYVRAKRIHAAYRNSSLGSERGSFSAASQRAMRLCD